MCKAGANCKRPLCFFAHNEAELRQPTALHDIPALRVKLAEAYEDYVMEACAELGILRPNRILVTIARAWLTHMLDLKL